ncbi:MAG: stress-responsive transcriptional regulator [Firmicutes bacterium HGW-Firmicutes-12]|jgi:phage shock protein PspC (stress-responsive transcriptional regulator)|nr:MAG: stress-responsive transcriptional regulator [Firmicutes bacterium HGW-Firmicutes-12]
MTDKLHKSKTDKVLAGVCGGIAEYFNVDSTLIRLAWVLAVFFAGSGLIVYILAMIIMPDDRTYIVKNNSSLSIETIDHEKENGEGEQVTQNIAANEDESKRHQILGLILVGLGGYFLFEKFFPYFRLHNWWPLILIFIGVAILLKSFGGNRR